MAAAGHLELRTPPQVQRTLAGPAPLPRVLYALLLSPGHKFGSIEEQIVTLARRFRAEGSLFLPLFISDAEERGLDFYRKRGVDAECLDLRRLRPRVLRRLLGLLRTNGIDAVHWNFTAPLGNPYLWWLTVLRPGLRHFFTDHISRSVPMSAPPRGPKRWLKRLLLHRYERVFCVSDFVRDCLHRQHVLAEERLTTCLHFVNTERFRPDAGVRDRLRRELNADGRFVVLAVAQLIEAKGIDVLIAAMAQTPADAQLWIIGDGAHRAALEAQTAVPGLAGRARFLGHQLDVCPYMQAADCFVCPSRWAEAAGLVNVEAAACGLPVLASRIGGIPEYLDDGRTGFLFEPGDVTMLAEQLRQLMDDCARCRQMGAQARAMAVERFSTDARVPDVLDLYRHGHAAK